MAGNGVGAVRKLLTGIAGFDAVSNGGIPEGRTTLVAGTAGSAKTVFAAQFLAEGIRRGEPGVFVTFEETPADIRRNMVSLGWPITEWEAASQWVFVDASPEPGEELMVSGEYDLGALLARTEAAIRRAAARRVALDSLGAIMARFPDVAIVRRELLRIAAVLKSTGVTSLVTAERTQEYGDISRYGVEEFVADNVIVLRNVLEGEKRRRTLEILKFRGTSHQKGEFPFTVAPGRGLVTIPLCAIELGQHSSDERISSGSPEMDAMCGGGFFRDSIVLVSGATGTGKTLMATAFLAGAKQDERCLLFAFEESREQLCRNARGWGIDFEGLERENRLRLVCSYPETAGTEDHLLRMQDVIREFRPHRLALDSLSALERVSTRKGFREFVIGLTAFIKEEEIAGLFTSTTESLVGGGSVTEAHISTITDSIILLRYVEMLGEMHRGITVLKMRGSLHEKEIREFIIDGHGMHIGKAFRNITGILAGNPVHVAASELERIEALLPQ